MSYRPPSRSPWQHLYEAALRQRRRRARGRRLDSPVLSVGNLHWGGGGKTPLARAIAIHLREAGRRVTVLSRGYGRRSKGPLVVSRGDGALVPVEDSGDEAALLARTEGLRVVVAEQRFEGGRLAERTFETDVFLLDDGFSHVDLARDVDLLAFPAADPWAGARLLPTGRLREPLSFARLADAVLLTGVDGSTTSDSASHQLDELRSGLSGHGYDGPLFASTSETELRAASAPDRVLLVSGVARPDSVRRSAEALAQRHGFTIVGELRYRDHEAYSGRRLDEIRGEQERLRADTVLVTEKDRVKLDERLSLGGAQLAEIRLAARPSADFFGWLDQKLANAPPA